MSASESQTESLSHRELRNQSGRVLRAVSEGQSFVLTNGGVPGGRRVPIDAPARRLAIARPAKRVGGWADLRPKPTENDRSISEVIDELREDRV